MNLYSKDAVDRDPYVCFQRLNTNVFLNKLSQLLQAGSDDGDDELLDTSRIVYITLPL